MKYIYHIITLVALGLLSGSCTRDQIEASGNREGEQPVIITLGAPETRSGTILYTAKDYDISSLRVMGYRRTDGSLAFNEYVPASDFSVTGTNEDIVRQAQVGILTGGFHFVFIANEKFGSATSNILDDNSQVATYEMLKQHSFPISAFNQTDEIPMVTVVENVIVLGDNKIQMGSIVYSGVWNVDMERLAVRVELALEMSDAFAAGNPTLSFANVPDKVYIFPKDNTASTAPVTIQAVTGNPTETTTTDGKKLTWTRLILPECWFNPVSDDSKAVEVCLTSGSDTKKAKIGKVIDDTDPDYPDYTMPRNHYFDIVGTVEENNPELKIILDVQPWTPVPVDPMPGNIILNVSTIEATISDRTMARIYFSSNVPGDKLYIYPQTDGNLEVDNIFYGLTGTTPGNLHYEYNTTTKEGSGYFDLITDHYLSGFGDGQHKIYLTAGNYRQGDPDPDNTTVTIEPFLQREITVKVNKKGDALSNYTKYVGAFWRDNQTGERVIAIPNTGKWTATVDHSGAEAPGGWVVLAGGKPFNPDFFTDNPGDPELYQVEGDSTTIKGTGDIYFRIGLKSQNTTIDSETRKIKPRYAKVVITDETNTTIHTLYLRQGEEPDYLMRNGTADAGNTITNRTAAQRFTVYNLTSSEYLDDSNLGGPGYADHSMIGLRAEGSEFAAFTQYPTQAGAYFQWSQSTVSRQRVAWHPVEPAGSITGWSTAFPNQDSWDKLAATHETCPQGYRRPHNGYTNAAMPNNGPIEGSEMRESLWLNPQVGAVAAASNTDNSLYGYYADGFFDRRPVTASVIGSSTMCDVSYSTVSATNSKVAYRGLLMFNPNNSASLFFPASGMRYYGNGSLGGNEGTTGNAGAWGGYWTSTSAAQNFSWNLSFTYFAKESDAVRMLTEQRHYGRPIRCVVGVTHIWTSEDRILARKDARLYQNNVDDFHMTWTRAMGIATIYNTSYFYNSGYSTNTTNNFGYDYIAGAIENPVSGCRAYWEEHQDDPITGREKWFMPTREELQNLQKYGLLDLQPDGIGGTNEGYWCSQEGSLATQAYLVTGEASASSVSKTVTNRTTHTRCVRKPTAAELANGGWDKQLSSLQ